MGPEWFLVLFVMLAVLALPVIVVVAVVRAVRTRSVGAGHLVEHSR